MAPLMQHSEKALMPRTSIMTVALLLAGASASASASLSLPLPLPQSLLMLRLSFTTTAEASSAGEMPVKRPSWEDIWKLAGLFVGGLGLRVLRERCPCPCGFCP